MTAPTGNSKKHCVLVALDRSPHGRAAIERAVLVAARLHAELIGIYVEDEDLVRLSALPFACEVTTHRGVVHALDIDSMRRRLQAEAALVRRDFEHDARARSVQARFVIRRGAVTSEILAACSDADQVVVGRSRRGTRHGRPGATASALARTAGRPVWLVQSRQTRAEALLLLLDATVDVDGAVAACSRVAEPTARWIIAISPEASPDDAATTRERAERALARERRSAEFVAIGRPDAATLTALLAQLGEAVVALPVSEDRARADRTALLAESLPCNVLVIPALRPVARVAE